MSLGTRLQELLKETFWGACLFGDLKNARGSLHQHFPLEGDGSIYLYFLGTFAWLWIPLPTRSSLGPPMTGAS